MFSVTLLCKCVSNSTIQNRNNAFSWEFFGLSKIQLPWRSFKLEINFKILWYFFVNVISTCVASILVCREFEANICRNEMCTLWDPALLMNQLCQLHFYLPRWKFIIIGHNYCLSVKIVSVSIESFHSTRIASKMHTLGSWRLNWGRLYLCQFHPKIDFFAISPF